MPFHPPLHKPPSPSRDSSSGAYSRISSKTGGFEGEASDPFEYEDCLSSVDGDSGSLGRRMRETVDHILRDDGTDCDSSLCVVVSGPVRSRSWFPRQSSSSLLTPKRRGRSTTTFVLPDQMPPNTPTTHDCASRETPNGQGFEVLSIVGQSVVLPVTECTVDRDSDADDDDDDGSLCTMSRLLTTDRELMEGGSGVIRLTPETLQQHDTKWQPSEKRRARWRHWFGGRRRRNKKKRRPPNTPSEKMTELNLAERTLQHRKKQDSQAQRIAERKRQYLFQQRERELAISKQQRQSVLDGLRSSSSTRSLQIVDLDEVLLEYAADPSVSTHESSASSSVSMANCGPFCHVLAAPGPYR